MLRTVASHLVGDEAHVRSTSPRPTTSACSPHEPTLDPHPLHSTPLFSPGAFKDGLAASQLASLELDGYLLLPGLLTPSVTEQLIQSIKDVSAIGATWKQRNRPKSALAKLRQRQAELEGAGPVYASDGHAERLVAFERDKAMLLEQFPQAQDHSPGACPYEWSSFFEGVIGHPDMLQLARSVLGNDIRFDHQVIVTHLFELALQPGAP
jgi:hypothetical protein